MHPVIRSHREEIIALCKKHGIERLCVVGSLARGDDRPDSDADLLYRFHRGEEPGWSIVRVEDDFAALLGRPVDLIPERALNQRWREYLSEHLEVVHDEAA